MEKYDVFISHCSRDKLKYVDDLVLEIKALGIKVFYDSESITWGDNIKDKIDEALKNSSLAVVVISKSFLDREWTNYELEELLNRQESNGEKLILPLLYRISKKQMEEKYKFLSNIHFLYAKKYSKKEIAKKLKIELNKKLIKNNDNNER